MSRCRTILGCVALSWLLVDGLASPAWCQIRAMPLNTAKEMFPLLEDNAAETPEYEGALEYEATPGYEDPAFSDAFQRMNYLEDVPTVSVAPVTPVYRDTLAPDNATQHLVSPNQEVFSDDYSQSFDMRIQSQQVGNCGQEIYGGGDFWTWQAFPDGLIYKSYMAGGRESRFASQWIHERSRGWLWDITLGGRVGLLRFGTQNDVWPEGWQLDIEGAVFPRLALERHRDLVSADFRCGVPLTYRRGPWEGKLAYYHLSSHLGDEFLATFPTASRINYVRDAVVLGVALRPHADLRLYTEAGWAFFSDGGSRPWEFQFGVDYSPLENWCLFGTPFFAANGRLRQEVDYGGNLTVQTGLQWRGRTGQLFRFGFHYFNGKSDQYQFFQEHEEQIGVGMWYDY